jgi:hypothetical protein
MMHAALIEVAPSRPADSIKGLFAIYALSCFLLNRAVHLAPIGLCKGADIGKEYWLDNVTWQLFALWWALLFGFGLDCSDFWAGQKAPEAGARWRNTATCASGLPHP